MSQPYCNQEGCEEYADYVLAVNLGPASRVQIWACLAHMPHQIREMEIFRDRYVPGAAVFQELVVGPLRLRG